MWIVALGPSDFRRVALALDRACELSGMKHESLAALMDLTKMQLADQKSGRKHLSVPRMRKLWDHRDGRRFLRFFLCELVMPTEIDRRLTQHARRMVKASLREPVREQESA